VVAGGVVAGFPLLTSYALVTAPATHGAVVIALLPAATAVVAVLRARERPRVLFWVLAAIGAAAAISFAAIQGGAFGRFELADLLLFGAVVAAAIGYAEGGLLARELGAWQTISWALVVAAPVMIPLAVVSAVLSPPTAQPIEWAAFAYLAVVSMFLGFFAWYRGLAIGPMAQVSQVQLVQPVLSILWAAMFLAEELTLTTVIGGTLVILFAGLAVRIRLDRIPPTTSAATRGPSAPR
ncbi:MAG: DMT family transporter, partial [Rhodoglobus sp.]